MQKPPKPESGFMRAVKPGRIFMGRLGRRDGPAALAAAAARFMSAGILGIALSGRIS